MNNDRWYLAQWYSSGPAGQAQFTSVVLFSTQRGQITTISDTTLSFRYYDHTFWFDDTLPARQKSHSTAYRDSRLTAIYSVRRTGFRPQQRVCARFDRDRANDVPIGKLV
jgi:hypothetical protein